MTAVFAALFIALYVGHQVGDHWIQQHEEVRDKGKPGWVGRRACALHVTTLTLTKVIAVTSVTLSLTLHLNLWAVGIALLVDAISHYWVDRRTTLEALAGKVRKGEFYALGDGMTAPCGTGAYALDQSWHHAWILIAALIASIGGAA